jgi:hypothetical protein
MVITSLNEIMINGQYVKMWEKSIVAYFKVLSSPLCEEIEENHKYKN